MLKIAIRLLLLQVIFILTPVLTAFLSLRFQPFTTADLKQNLVQSGAYTQIPGLLEEQIMKLEESNEDDDQLITKFWPLIQAEITPAYIQNKTERFIDDTNHWVVGKTAEAPLLSFEDIKQKLLNKNRKMLDQLVALVEEMKQAQIEAQQVALANNEEFDEQAFQQLQDFNPKQIVTQEWVVQMGPYLQWLKTLRTVINTGLPVMIGILVLTLAAIIFLSGDLQSKLRWISVAFLSGSIGCGLSLLFKSLIGTIIANTTLHNADKMPGFIAPLLSSLTEPIIQSYLRYETLFTVALFIAFVSCFVVSLIISQPTIKVAPKGK